MKYFSILICFATLLILSSCENFLSVRPNSSYIHARTTKDLQGLLDATSKMNIGTYSYLNDASTDDFFLGKVGFDRLSDFLKNVYLWQTDPFYEIVDINANWLGNFHVIAVSNSVLEELDLVSEDPKYSRDEIKGSALFYRAYSYLNLVQIYCPAFNLTTANQEWGLPLRFSSDINVVTKRSKLDETYIMIENDFLNALDLLPEYSIVKTRPSKLAVYAALARMYLFKGNYEEAMKYSKFALSLSDYILDFNNLNVSQSYPIPPLNDEIIFFASSSTAPILTSSLECYIDTNLINEYQNGDLRMDLFYKKEKNGFYTFRGSYLGSGANNCFVGLTVSETLLILAECLARLNKVDEALNYLNKLLENRYEFNLFIPLIANNQMDAINLVLNERRKELIFRGVRWSDLKRLNLDPLYAKTIYRKIPGKNELVELNPNDLRYTYLLPQQIVELAKFPQNKR